jgi:HlyD family secretion protein
MKHPWINLLLGGLLLSGGCRFQGDGSDGSGTIECTQVQVAPQVAGRIIQLAPQEGDIVKQGDVVAQIDPADFELRRAETEAAVGQAQAQLELLQAGSRQEDIQRARAQVREAQAMAQAAALDFDRIRKVFEEKSATQKQYDDARLASDKAAAVQAQAEQNLARLVAGNRPEDIRIAQAQVNVARARLAQAEKALADCRVTAAMDGVVTTRSHEPGEMVASGTTLITVSRLDEVWLSLYVPEPKLSQLKLGQKAWAKVNGRKEPMEGKLTFISPEAEFTPKNVQTPEERAKLVYRIKVTLTNADRVFKPGMPADGYLGARP